MKIHAFVFVLSLIITTGFCSAENYSWINSAGGAFGDPCNWDPTGVPGQDDIATFNLLTDYTVTFTGGYFNDQLIVDGSDMTMDLAGNMYFIDYSADDGGLAVIIGSTLGEYESSLAISNGIVYSRHMSIGQLAGATGHLTVSGSDTSWTLMYEDCWYGLWLGEEGTGTLSVLDNAQFRHGHGWSAVGTDSSATINVDGTDSEWYVDGQFVMSVCGETTLNIDNGGRARFNLLRMAEESGSFAQINLTNTDQDTELAIESDVEDSLTVGLNGQASILTQNSKIYNAGNMLIAANADSTGLLEIHEGSWVDSLGSVAVGGTLDAAGGIGQIKIIDDDPNTGLTANFTPTSQEGQSFIVWPQGTITMDGGIIEAEYDSCLANPIILRGGTLEGHGMIWAYVQNIGGIVAPQDDQNNKKLEIGYNYTQDADATLKIEIGGINQVSDYSLLQVNNSSVGFGEVSLDGTLNVTLTDDFVPAYEDEFVIIIAGTITGTFSNASEHYLLDNGGGFDIVYNTDSVVLTHYIADAGCTAYPQADFNKDCIVDLADFAVLASEWLECNLYPASYCPGQEEVGE